MSCFHKIILITIAIAWTFIFPLSDANADLVLSQLIVELAPGDRARADVEALNNGPDRIFVAIDAREILAPGTPSESKHNDPDPDKLGLLVSPPRMILEAGQRRLVRIAAISASDQERVYRVTVKPVVGNLSSESSGLKVLVGYDMLVLVRPTEIKPHVSGQRTGGKLILHNDGNVSVELVEGEQCTRGTKACQELTGGRLYAGAEKTIELATDRTAEFKLKVGDKLIPVQF